jgi:hypothetical protein
MSKSEFSAGRIDRREAIGVGRAICAWLTFGVAMPAGAPTNANAALYTRHIFEAEPRFAASLPQVLTAKRNAI